MWYQCDEVKAGLSYKMARGDRVDPSTVRHGIWIYRKCTSFW
jgi:hypothetical protein